MMMIKLPILACAEEPEALVYHTLPCNELVPDDINAIQTVESIRKLSDLGT